MFNSKYIIISQVTDILVDYHKWNIPVHIQAHDCSVRSMNWSHNGKWMVTTDDRGFVKYWQINFNNVHTFQAHNEPVRSSRWDILGGSIIYCHMIVIYCHMIVTCGYDTIIIKAILLIVRLQAKCKFDNFLWLCKISELFVL